MDLKDLKYLQSLIFFMCYHSWMMYSPWCMTKHVSMNMSTYGQSCILNIAPKVEDWNSAWVDSHQFILFGEDSSFSEETSIGIIVLGSVQNTHLDSKYAPRVKTWSQKIEILLDCWRHFHLWRWWVLSLSCVEGFDIILTVLIKHERGAIRRPW